MVILSEESRVAGSVDCPKRVHDFGEGEARSEEAKFRLGIFQVWKERNDILDFV